MRDNTDIPKQYRDLILHLGMCESMGDAARRGGFLEKAIDYYGDAYESIRTVRDECFAAELDTAAADADFDRVNQKWQSALDELGNRNRQRPKPIAVPF